ncbi:MAG: hypothetical protein AVDCRST_MAG93-2211, partial [uncultured Chloroflexia bacterium]
DISVVPPAPAEHAQPYLGTLQLQPTPTLAQRRATARGTPQLGFRRVV